MVVVVAVVVVAAAVVGALFLVPVERSAVRERNAETDAELQRRCRTLNLATIRKIEKDRTCANLSGRGYDRCVIAAAAEAKRELRDCDRCSGGEVTDCMVLSEEQSLE